MNKQNKYIFKVNRLKFRWYYLKTIWCWKNSKKYLGMNLRHPLIFFKNIIKSIYYSSITSGVFVNDDYIIVLNLPQIRKINDSISRVLIHEDLHSAMNYIKYAGRKQYKYKKGEENIIKKLMKV